MIKSLVNIFFGCAHGRTTFPLTPSRNSKTPDRAGRGAYIVCLDCGKEFDYNWQEMCIGKPSRHPALPIDGLKAEKRTARKLRALHTH